MVFGAATEYGADGDVVWPAATLLLRGRGDDTKFQHTFSTGIKACATLGREDCPRAAIQISHNMAQKLVEAAP